MIQADSSRYEVSQLPIKSGTKLIVGAITEVVKSNTDNGAGFVKVIKIMYSQTKPCDSSSF